MAKKSEGRDVLWIITIFLFAIIGILLGMILCSNGNIGYGILSIGYGFVMIIIFRKNLGVIKWRD